MVGKFGKFGKGLINYSCNALLLSDDANYDPTFITLLQHIANPIVVHSFKNQKNEMRNDLPVW
jgi:hypothetical protein